MPDFGKVFDCALKMQSEQKKYEISVAIESHNPKLALQVSTLCNVAMNNISWNDASACKFYEEKSLSK